MGEKPPTLKTLLLLTLYYGYAVASFIRACAIG